MKSRRPTVLKSEPELAEAVRVILRGPRPSLDSPTALTPDQIVRLLWDDVAGLRIPCPECKVGIAFVCSFGGILSDGGKVACCETCTRKLVVPTRGLAELSSPIEMRLEKLGWTMAPYAFGPQNFLVTAAGVPEGRFSVQEQGVGLPPKSRFRTTQVRVFPAS